MEDGFKTLSVDDHLMSAFRNGLIWWTIKTTTILLYTHGIHIEVGESWQPSLHIILASGCGGLLANVACNACQSACVETELVSHWEL